MAHPKIIQIFSGSDVKHGISLFNNEEIEYVEGLILEKDNKFLILDQIKNKYRPAKPEEIVRQLFLYRLITAYNYPKIRLDIERVVVFGSRESGFADIVVLDDDLKSPYIIIEIKRPRRSDGLEQLKSYCNAEGATMGIWSNGNEMLRLHREEPNTFVEIPRIPTVTETLRDILTERWTIKWLEEHDELRQGKTTLKKILLDLEELVLGNAGVEPFEEIFKLIYAKLYDEWRGINDNNYQLQFFVGDRNAEKVKAAITNLLDGSKKTWAGIFQPTEKIELRNNHLKVCISFLEKIKLFNSNLTIIDEAFEYLIPQVSKKKEGQFFTPRPVEDMIVKALNPKPHEIVVDPACGSAGFLLHSVMWIAQDSLTGKELPLSAKNFGQNNIVGIDLHTKAVKIAKAINLIVGDGKSHIFHDNSLAPQSWSEDTRIGLRSRLVRFPQDQAKDTENQDNFKFMDFDILMTNPPFAGTVAEREVLRNYELAENKGRIVDRRDRHILFLNRAFQLVREGGRLGIILPQGILNNTKTEYIRKYIVQNGRILGVIGLHANTFKPHTGTKTSVVLIQKYSNEEIQNVNAIKAGYELDWERYYKRLLQTYRDVNWNKQVSEKDIDSELRSFSDSYFGEEEEEEAPLESRQSVDYSIREFYEITELYSAKNKESQSSKKKNISKELNELRKKMNKLELQICMKTTGGQIHLILNDPATTQQFKDFWLSNKMVKKIDYPIFFAVNQKPLKDTSGDYIYRTEANGEYFLDSNGHRVLDHDLEEIADSFVEFAKNQKFEFW